MTQYRYIISLAIILLLINLFSSQNVFAQNETVSVSGTVVESGSGLPLKQVSVTIASTGEMAETNDKGEFSIKVLDLNSELIFDLPGYIKRNIFLLGRAHLSVSMVTTGNKSFDEIYNSPTGTKSLKDAVSSTTAINSIDLKNNAITSFETGLQGRVPGLNIIGSSGLPGSLSWINMGGVSSMYCRNEPLLFIDGMIEDYNYSANGLMEGFYLNPLDVLDIEDISDLSVIRNGISDFGALGSNGIIYVNTEQKNEASTVIQASAYTGISLVPKKLDVMNASQFKTYFLGRLAEEGYSGSAIDQLYPWLNGSSGSDEYYRYNNNTDWQREMYSPGAISKFHVFLKGGDDIATYNISVGYLNHHSVYEGSRYSRFNLRVNGMINVTDKFSLTPNVKLSLGDSYVANQGPSTFKNPLVSGLLTPPILRPDAVDEMTGISLPYLDDVSVFNVSNPIAIIKNAIGDDRNYNFLSSIKAKYNISSELSLNNILGINFNNARENIFLPNRGLVQVDSAANSPQVFVNDFRSTQETATIDYHRSTPAGHMFNGQAGVRILMNSYKYNKVISLNTPSDDFKNLGEAAKYTYLRTSTGDNRKLYWVSYFALADYNYQSKYYVSIRASVDGNSAASKNERYNFFPSVGAAWRLSSEEFLSDVKWIDDLKLRTNWSITGNVYSSVYDFSKLYYTEVRNNTYGVPVREAIPNPNLELERKMTINGGLDLTLFHQTTNIHVDFFKSMVNNLIIQQALPATYGYTTYYDNGGKLSITGLEAGLDERIKLGTATLKLGATITLQKQNIDQLTFIKTTQENIITQTGDAEYITQVGGAMNAFYGYKTNGLFQTDEEASQYTGTKGNKLKAGDIRFVDVDGNKIINDLDKVSIGDPNPDFFGGITAALEFGKIQVSALFNYSVGNEIYNFVRRNAESMDTYCNQLNTVLDRWTSSNNNGTLPRAAYGDPSGNSVFSNRWIEDGSYLSLKQLSVSYEMPSTKFYRGLTLYVTGNNLFAITKYSGYDPEFMYSNSPFYMGIDYGKIPHVRSFIFGLKLDL